MRSTRGLWCCFLLALLIGGCGGGGGGGGDGTPVYITAQRTMLAAFREGNDPWQVLSIGAQGGTDVFVNGPFTVVGVCNDFGGEVYAFSGGPEDADEFWDVGCGPATDTDVTITNSGGGTLWVRVGQYWSAYVTGTYTLQVPAGVHDIILADREAHRVEVRRGVSIFADTTLDVNLATTGVAMTSRPLTGGTNTTSSFRTTNDVGLAIAYDTATAWSVPSSIAQNGDKHWAAARQVDSAMPRYSWRTTLVTPGSTAPLAVTVPPQLESATFTWTNLPTIAFTGATDWHTVTLTGYQNDADYAPLYYQLRYPGAQGTPGSITFPDVTTIPGWSPAWTVNGSQPWNLYLDVSRPLPDDTGEGASWDREAAPPAVRAAIEQRTLARLQAR